MTKKFDRLLARIGRNVTGISSAFEELKPSLDDRVLETTAIVAYHRPPIKEDDPDIEKLVGLIFPPIDLKRRKSVDKTLTLYNRLSVYKIYKPKKPAVYLGIDEKFGNPKDTLLYGLQHLDKAPQKIMRNYDGSFYLTQKPLLSGANALYPSVLGYIKIMESIAKPEKPSISISELRRKVDKWIQKS